MAAAAMGSRTSIAAVAVAAHSGGDAGITVGAEGGTGGAILRSAKSRGAKLLANELRLVDDPVRVRADQCRNQCWPKRRATAIG
jgi:hypothetical protein